jgi:hypothetical protein
VEKNYMENTNRDEDLDKLATKNGERAIDFVRIRTISHGSEHRCDGRGGYITDFLVNTHTTEVIEAEILVKSNGNTLPPPNPKFQANPMTNDTFVGCGEYRYDIGQPERYKRTVLKAWFVDRGED